MQYPQEPFYTSKHLLSLWQCGCYIHTQNLITLGSALGMELPFKKRSSLLQTLLLHVKETHQESAFLSLMNALLDHKAQTLHENIAHYPKTARLMQPWLQKIEKTKHLITREFPLHVKEEHE